MKRRNDNAMQRSAAISSYSATMLRKLKILKALKQKARITRRFGLFALFEIVFSVWLHVSSGAVLSAQEALPCASMLDSTTLDSSSTQSAQSPQDRVFKPLQEFAPQSPVSTTATLTKDPVLAVCLSIIPGAGQIYVGRYWIAPLFLGGGGFLAYQTYTYHAQFMKYSRQYDALDSAALTSRDAVNIRRLRDGYNDLRDTFGVLFFGAVLVAAVDAYAGAHLYDFDVSDDLKASLYIRPTGVGIALRGNFALLK